MSETKEKCGMRESLRNLFAKYFSDPQVIILGVLLLSGFILIFLLGNMLVPVIAGVVIAYLLEGAVGWLERRRIPRKLAVVMVFVVFMAALLLLVIWLLPLLSRQVAQLFQELPAMIAAGQKELLHLPEKYPEIISKQQISNFINFLSNEVITYGQRLLGLSLASVRGAIALLVYLILVPLLVFFFLKDKEKILRWIRGLMPSDVRLAKSVWDEVNMQISNYVRGKVIEIAIVWFGSYVSFTFLDLRFALLISFFIGLSVIVPYIGATVITIPVVLIAFFQWGASSEFLYVIAAYLVIQALDGNLLVPVLLAGVVNLHPVAIIAAVLVFGGLWGIWGLFFAIPLATLVHAVLKAWLSSIRQQEEVTTP